MARNMTSWEKQIKKALMDRDMNMSDLAKELNVSHGYIYNIVSGNRKGVEVKEKINEYLGLGTEQVETKPPVKEEQAAEEPPKEEMTHEVIIGYMILTMKNLRYSEEQIERAVHEMRYSLQHYTKREAKNVENERTKDHE